MRDVCDIFRDVCDKLLDRCISAISKGKKEFEHSMNAH